MYMLKEKEKVGLIMAQRIGRDGKRQGAMMSALHQPVSSCLQSQHALLSHLASWDQERERGGQEEERISRENRRLSGAEEESCKFRTNTTCFLVESNTTHTHTILWDFLGWISSLLDAWRISFVPWRSVWELQFILFNSTLPSSYKRCVEVAKARCDRQMHVRWTHSALLLH